MSARVAAARARLAFRHERRERARLRIGYLSADFHDHVTPYVLAEMFELHDRSRFETVAYSYGPDDGSAMRARMRRDRRGSSMVRNDRNSEVALSGRLGSCSDERAAHRPSVWKIGSLSYPQVVSS